MAKPLAVHDPGKIVLDLAIAVALGGDCLADIGLLRAEPGVFGHGASDPTVSRLVTTLANNAGKAVTAPERLLKQARQEDAAHRAAHQKPISADTLRIRLGIGATRARRLVKAVREEYQAEVARHPVDADRRRYQGGGAGCPDDLDGVT